MDVISFRRTSLSRERAVSFRMVCCRMCHHLDSTFVRFQPVFLKPGAMGSRVPLSGTHLVYLSCHEFSPAHDGVWGEGGRVGILAGYGVLSCSFYKEHASFRTNESTLYLKHCDVEAELKPSSIVSVELKMNQELRNQASITFSLIPNFKSKVLY